MWSLALVRRAYKPVTVLRVPISLSGGPYQFNVERLSKLSLLLKVKRRTRERVA